MNRKQSKFIITKDGTLRIGITNRHCELLKPNETCIGGGYYELDYISHRMLLTGASSEYGEPKWEEIDTIKISAYYSGLEITYTPWSSKEDIFPVSEKIEITYT